MPTATASPATGKRPAKSAGKATVKAAGKAAGKAEPGSAQLEYSAAGDDNASAPAEPAAEPAAEPRLVNGLPVLADEPTPSGLPVKPGQAPIPIHSIRQLTLAGGTVVSGCRDCDYTGTRGEVQKHRYAEHGAGKPGRRAAAADDGLADLAAMPLGELLALARNAASWGEMFALKEQELADWRERALRAEAWRRRVVARLGGLGFKLDEDLEG